MAGDASRAHTVAAVGGVVLGAAGMLLLAGRPRHPSPAAVAMAAIVGMAGMLGALARRHAAGGPYRHQVPLRVEKYVTRTFPLSRADEAIACAAERSTMKVQLVCGEQ